MRPKRLYRTKTGKYYYIKNKKRVYIKTKPSTKLSQKQIVKINIKNIIGDKSRRVKPTRRRRKLKYTRKVDDSMKEIKKEGLPLYLFQPKKAVPSLFTTQTKAPPSKSYKDILDEITTIKNAFKDLKEEKTKPIKTTVEPEKKKRKKVGAPLFEHIKNLYTKSDYEKLMLDINDKYKPKDFVLLVFSTFNLDPIVETKRGKRYNYNELIKRMKEKGASITRKSISNIIGLSSDETKEAIGDIEEIDEIGMDTGEESDFYGSGNIQKGLYNDELEKIAKKVVKGYVVPVIAQNQLDELDQYVKPNIDKFGFIINTDSIPQKNKEGGHWIAVFINNSDDYQTIEYYDPLVSTPSKELIKKLKDIAYEMNPEQSFKLKINNLKTQSDSSDTCGVHSMLFLEKRFMNTPWSEASGYDDYINKAKPNDEKTGEAKVQKIIKKYSTYI